MIKSDALVACSVQLIFRAKLERVEATTDILTHWKQFHALLHVSTVSMASPIPSSGHGYRFCTYPSATRVFPWSCQTWFEKHYSSSRRRRLPLLEAWVEETLHLFRISEGDFPIGIAMFGSRLPHRLKCIPNGRFWNVKDYRLPSISAGCNSNYR